QLFGDAPKGGVLGNARVREENIEPALLVPDAREKAVEIAGVRHISLHAGCIVTNLLGGSGKFAFAAAGEVNVCALLGESARRGEADPSGAACYQCYLSIQFRHLVTSSVVRAAVSRLRQGFSRRQSSAKLKYMSLPSRSICSTTASDGPSDL